VLLTRIARVVAWREDATTDRTWRSLGRCAGIASCRGSWTGPDVIIASYSLASRRFAVKILVTGGAGFIGSAVIRHLLGHTGDCVVNLDKLTYAGNLESLAEVSDSPRYAFEQVDICDRAET